MVLAANPTIAGIPHLGSFLAEHPRAVLGWGRKRSSRIAHVMAAVLRRPCVLLEDGFIRSVERRSPPMSLMIDDIGMYYDAGAPSRMERTIAGGVTPAQADRARAIVRRWREGGVSKYNHAPDFAGALPERYVLVVDQTLGDLSLSKGQAGSDSFPAMLTAALAENPQDSVLVKVHPDTVSHGRAGNFAPGQLDHPRVQVIAESCHPTRLLATARRVYAVTSLMGFEALLWGRPVRCFGMPFYAGWGLTEDALPAPERRGVATLESLVHAALVACPRYVDPATGLPCEIEQTIDHVVAGRARLGVRG